MNVLFTAFNGKNNSSKVLLDYIQIDSKNKLYLKNSFTTSVIQLTNKIKNNDYDLVISFGQAPLENNTIKIETISNGEEKIETNYNYNDIKSLLEKKYNVILSKNAGNYLCNNIYYNGLKYIRENNLKSKMLFIHIPKIDNINNIELLSKILEKIN